MKSLEFFSLTYFRLQKSCIHSCLYFHFFAKLLKPSKFLTKKTLKINNITSNNWVYSQDPRCLPQERLQTFSTQLPEYLQPSYRSIIRKWSLHISFHYGAWDTFLFVANINPQTMYDCCPFSREVFCFPIRFLSHSSFLSSHKQVAVFCLLKYNLMLLWFKMDST